MLNVGTSHFLTIVLWENPSGESLKFTRHKFGLCLVSITLSQARAMIEIEQAFEIT